MWDRGHLFHSEGHRGKLEFVSAALFNQPGLAIGWFFFFSAIEILAWLPCHFHDSLKQRGEDIKPGASEE